MTLDAPVCHAQKRRRLAFPGSPILGIDENSHRFSVALDSEGIGKSETAAHGYALISLARQQVARGTACELLAFVQAIAEFALG